MVYSCTILKLSIANVAAKDIAIADIALEYFIALNITVSSNRCIMNLLKELDQLLVVESLLVLCTQSYHDNIY